MQPENIALVFGATGLVGLELVKTLAGSGKWSKVYGIARKKPATLNHKQVEFIEADLLDSQRTIVIPSNVTHVFYAALAPTSFAPEETEAVMYERNVSMLVRAAEAVEASCKNKPRFVLVEGTRAYGMHLGPRKFPGYKVPFVEALPRHPCPPLTFYYGQEDYLTEKGWLWTAVRPSYIVGSSFNLYHMVQDLAVYATLCKSTGRRLRFPGSTALLDTRFEFTSAHHLAACLEWCALEPKCGGQIFNCANGDVLTWRQLWPVVAQQFSLDYEFPTEHEARTILHETMINLDDAWSNIVKAAHLIPTRLEELVNWKVLDFIFQRDYDIYSSMDKTKSFGFTDQADTVADVIRCFQRLRENHVIPR